MKSACVKYNWWSLSAAVVLGLAVEAPAAKPVDWPHPRGPRLNGVIEGAVADTWNHGDPVLWRRRLGQGYSGFIVVAGRFYTQFQTSAGQHVGCYDLDTGQEIWRTRYALPWQLDGDWPGPYATPVHAEGHIFFAGCFGTLGCLRASDGKLIWSLNLSERHRGKGTEFGYARAPLVDDGRVFVPVGGKEASVVALDARSGKLIWKSVSEPASYCGSIAITVEGCRQIVSYLENITVAHDPENGTELWRHTRGHGYAEHAAWPIWHPPYLFYSEPFREGTHVLKLGYTNGAPHMSEVWRSDVLCNDIFSSVIVDGHIYGFDLMDYQAIHGGESAGRFKCVELATGVEKWATTNTAHAMVLTDQTNLVIFNEIGELILADADPHSYRERGRIRVFTNVQCWIAPAFYDGRLLLRAKTNMACVYLGGADAKQLTEWRGLAAVDTNEDGPGVFDRYHSDAYFAPTMRDFREWFWFSLLGVLLPVSALVAFLKQRQQTLLLAGTAIGGLLLCAPYTEWQARLVFTWPLAIHAIYFGATQICVNAMRSRSSRATWLARGALAFVILGCLGYHALCRHHFVVMGWGFLVGILPALPVTLTLQRMLSRLTPVMSSRPLLLAWLISFTVFYWSAALFISFRT